MHNFKELKVWQKSMDLAIAIYKVIACLPSEEKYGLVSQMKRCAISISSNIAEGSGRGSSAQFKYFLSISQGSAVELETQLILAKRLELLDDTFATDLIDRTIEIQKMDCALERKLTNK